MLLLKRQGAVQHCLVGLCLGRVPQPLPSSAVDEARGCSVCLCKAILCPVCHLYCCWLAALAEDHAGFLPSTPHTKTTIVAVVYLWLIPVKEYLHKTLISRFSICSGLLLLGALKRPTESAKNQCTSIQAATEKGAGCR